MTDKNIVALLHCPICEEPSGVAISKNLNKAIPEKMFDQQPCEKCQAIMKDNVTFFCDCGSRQIVSWDFFERNGIEGVNKGGIYRLKQCKYCDPKGNHAF